MNHNHFNNSPEPTNASEAFADESRRHEGRIENVLDSEAAAYAARPFMDVAVKGYNARKAAYGSEENESIGDIDIDATVQTLIQYAEKRAHEAARGERDPGLTPDEEVLIDTFAAQAEMEEALAETDAENIIDSAGDVDKAYALAMARAKTARVNGDREEAKKWSELARHADAYNDAMYNPQNLDSSEQYQSRQKVLPNLSHSAGYISMLAQDGRVSGETVRKVHQASEDAANLRRTAELYKLFAEVKGQEAAQSAHEKRMDKAAKLNELRQETSRMTTVIDASIFNDDAGYQGAMKIILRKARESRAAGDEAGMKKWRDLGIGYNEFNDAWERDESDRFPTDLEEAGRRRDLISFFAEQYPKQKKEAQQNQQGYQAQVTPGSFESFSVPISGGERVTNTEQMLFNEVLAAAKGNVMIEADVPGNADLRVGSQLTKFNGSRRGFNVFGSAAPENGYADLGLSKAETVEAVQFQSVAREGVYEDVVVKKRFGKSETVRRFKGQKEVPLPDVMNPATGRQEPGVAFRYSFRPSITKDMPEGTPGFVTNDGRGGNMLNIATVLPKSVADKLEATIRKDPQSVRDIVRQLVMIEGNIPQDVWTGTRPREDDPSRTNAAMRPPYDKLPQGWRISLYGNEAYKGSPYESLPV